MLCACAILFTFSGCQVTFGTGQKGTNFTEREAVAQTVRDYYTALVRADGRNACQLLTQKGQRALVRQVGMSPGRCPAAVAMVAAALHAGSRKSPEQLLSELTTGIEADAVTIQGKRAILRFTYVPEGKLRLVRAAQGGRWLLTAPYLERYAQPASSARQ